MTPNAPSLCRVLLSITRTHMGNYERLEQGIYVGAGMFDLSSGTHTLTQ